MKHIKNAIEKFGFNESASIDNASLADHAIDSVNILTDYLVQDLPINTVERFEQLFKDMLKAIFSRKIATSELREIITIQQRLGFILKYKSYAIKASNPLGYSVFIQNKGEGFSFQQHILHKTEVFHILEVLDGGYVFLCDYKDWLESYEEKAFADWLAGNPDKRYERFRIYPKPGDVFSINKLGVVHTVIGCLLEEYATVSTDMVDRLFDQNAGKKIPTYFNRRYALDKLQSIKFPVSSRHVNFDTGSQQEPITQIMPIPITGGTRSILSENTIIASRYTFEPSKVSERFYDEHCASCLYFTRGKGQLILGNEEEVNRLTPPTVQVNQGDLLIIPNGVYYAFAAEDSGFLELSEQKIPLDVAFV
jgi:mannose-6-phosphate isomerase-like protein (cupin superfamily)